MRKAPPNAASSQAGATLTERERRFVEAYMGEAAGNATEAAKLAGYSAKSARRIGTRLSSKDHIKSAIAERQRVRTGKADIDAVRVLQELARIGLSDVRTIFSPNGDNLLRPNQWSEDTARAIASIEVVVRPTGDEEQPFEHVHKIKFWDKNSALEKIAKHLGMFVDKHEHDVTLRIPERVVFNVTKVPGADCRP